MHPWPDFSTRCGGKARDISQFFYFYFIKFANLSAWPSYAILFSGRWANLNQEVTVHGQAQHRSHGAGCPADHHLSPQKQDLVFRDHRALRPELPAPLCRLALDLLLPGINGRPGPGFPFCDPHRAGFPLFAPVLFRRPAPPRKQGKKTALTKQRKPKGAC